MVNELKQIIKLESARSRFFFHASLPPRNKSDRFNMMSKLVKTPFCSRYFYSEVIGTKSLMNVSQYSRGWRMKTNEIAELSRYHKPKYFLELEMASASTFGLLPFWWELLLLLGMIISKIKGVFELRRFLSCPRSGVWASFGENTFSP